VIPLTLDAAIAAKRQEIHTDAYPMSIGELANLYVEGDLDIHPEFQRIYRWKEPQKSRLIESILLGIPLPSIFVAQRDDGIWDVVDGVQRLSTIFSFLGIYLDENGNRSSPLVLTGTDQLPTLAGIQWEASASASESGFSKELQRAFKREKIDIKIIKKESDSSAKFELFQRLNTLGSSLSPQEVRNCLLLMIDKDFYRWLLELSSYQPFKNTLTLTERQFDEQYDMELVTRFIVLVRPDWEQLAKLEDVGQYLTDAIRKLVSEKLVDRATTERVFKETFDLLSEAYGENAFRREANGQFKGAFSIALFEAIAVGLGASIDKHSPYKGSVSASRQKIISNLKFETSSGSGVRGTTRMPQMVAIGKSAF
jgi:Protein of unknown function DUF262